jgi:hypothetical protein
VNLNIFLKVYRDVTCMLGLGIKAGVDLEGLHQLSCALKRTTLLGEGRLQVIF